jgi:hypothetical protein
VSFFSDRYFFLTVRPGYAGMRPEEQLQGYTLTIDRGKISADPRSRL